MRKDIDRFIQHYAYDKEVLFVNSKCSSLADYIITSLDGYKPSYWRIFFDAEEIVDNDEFSPTKEQIDEVKQYLRHNYGKTYPLLCADNDDNLIRCDVRLLRYAIKVLREYNYRMCGFDDVVTYIKHEKNDEAILMWFECDHEISCAVVYPDGSVFAVDDWQGAHPDGFDDIPKYDWEDAKEESYVVILNGLPRKFK